jgi:hypothetical protein
MVQVAEARRNNLNSKINHHRRSFSSGSGKAEQISNLSNLNLNTARVRGRTLSSDNNRVENSETLDSNLDPLPSHEQFQVLKTQQAEMLVEVKDLKLQMKQLVEKMS